MIIFVHRPSNQQCNNSSKSFQLKEMKHVECINIMFSIVTFWSQTKRNIIQGLISKISTFPPLHPIHFLFNSGNASLTGGQTPPFITSKTSSTDLGQIVMFSQPSFVTQTLSSNRTPPNPRNLFNLSDITNFFCLSSARAMSIKGSMK
mmetsp:Transcript_5572/g.11873  ORF Transcript_5572/g.11873 Transcript_5572/m.11873 type:complete len:148 (+) Transcript_5572:123-566(+)